MQKKNYILIGIATLLLIGLVYFLIKQPKGEKYENIDTIMGVPINSELVIHIPDLENFIEKSNTEKIWTELKKTELITHFQNLQSEFSTVLNEQEISELLDDSQLTIATKIAGRNSIETSYIFPLYATNKKTYIKKLLKSSLKDFQITTRSYSGFDLNHAINDKREKEYYYAFADGLFIFSSSQILLEDALLQIKNNNSLLDKESFQTLKKIASSKDDINIFINGKTFTKLLSLGLDKKYSTFIKELSDFTTEVGLDMKISDNKVLLNGFLYTDTDDFFYTNILLNQEPVDLRIEEVIPANTQFWSALSLSDEDLYFDNYLRYLEQTGDIKEYRKFSENFRKHTSLYPEQFIYPILENEIGLVISSDNVLNESANKYCVLRTKSKSETLKSLETLLEQYQKNTSKETSISTYKVDATLSYNIYEFPFSNFAHMMWGGMFYETETKYCAFVGNYLIFGSKVSSLEKYIDYNVRRKTLKHDDFYQREKKFWVGNESSFAAYCKIGDGHFFNNYIKENLKQDVNDKEEIFKKFPSFGLQIKNIKDMLYVNGYISFSENQKKAPETIWQSRLDNPLRKKPQIVKNHKTKSRELILQDTKNILYLVSDVGRILWKLPLDNQILGTIHQVDAYKNNKLQYLFNTKDKLYLIDRNGNSVGNFPIKLRSPATNALALFDYDKNRNYRVFISSEDKKTYLYNIEGKLIEGWEADNNEHDVLSPVQHFVNDSKDYIIYNDGYKNYILNRRGQVRATPKKNFEKADNSDLVIDKSNSNHKASIIATDTKGLVYYTYLDGSVKTKDFGEFSKDHFFTSFDLDNDGINEFIFIDKDKLYVFKQDGDKIFDYQFETNDLSKPNFYNFSNKEKKIGLRAGNKIYLFNSNGSIYDGFPLEGYSNFSIGFMNKNKDYFNLFVAGSNDLLYNYKVE